MAIMIASLFSTGLSGIWCILPIISFRYPIGKPGQPGVELASTIVALLAKAIELSFVLTCASCIAEEFSRRLTNRSSSGITVAEMQLRSFLYQPGAMFTHYKALLNAAKTVPGLLTVIAMISATFYTTASDTLVSPKASLRPPSQQRIPASVSSAFSNSTYIQNTCPVLVSVTEDPTAFNSCDAVVQTADAFRNFVSYVDTFHSLQSGLNGSLLPQERPPPVATYNDLISVQGSWLHEDGLEEDITYAQSYIGNSRVINNVTMLLPHAGVVSPSQRLGDALTPPDSNVSLSMSSI